MTVSSPNSLDGNPRDRARITALLKRYPHLDDSEIEELVAFYRTAPAVDTALLTCDDEIRANIAAFTHQFRKRIRRWGDANASLVVYGLFFAALIIALILRG